MDKISEFFDMCKLFDDDIDLIVKAIKELGEADNRPSQLKMWCEYLNVKKLEPYTNKILDTKLCDIKAWKRSKLNRQLNIYDFL